MKKNQIIKKIGGFSVELTNLDKIFWPGEGITKGDVINYYESISKFILPHLKGRPLSLKRNPNGIADKGFYHKDAGENAPAYASVYPVESKSDHKTIDYLVCNNKATLLYLANLGCIEMNPWNSTVKHPSHPTWMVIDLDPSAKNTFEQVVETALAASDVLRKAGLKSFPKTSGATGLHIYIPLKDKYPYELIRNLAHLVVSHIQQQLPDTTSIERSLQKRGSKIYLDWLQNSEGQTLASVYSIRPVKGAFVSTPLEWKEVNKNLHPSQFTIRNMPARIINKGDLFKGVLSTSNDVKKAMKFLEK